MIKIDINKNIIKISGHANFNTHGNDIVCASVSSIVYTTINGILNIDNTAIKYTDNKDLIIEVISKEDTINKLIMNMIWLLDELAKQYPKNIKISKGE